MKLAEIFSNDMVFQRNRKICVFGTGKGEGTITFCGETVNFTSEKDSFRVYLSPKEAGGPYEMVVVLNGETTIYTNILVGDVYVAAGQSNMQVSLAGTSDIELKDCPDVRFFTEPHAYYFENQRTCDLAVWRRCVGEESLRMTAVGYYFATRMYEETGVPIGIISVNWGSSRVDAWTSPEIVYTKEYQRLMPVKGDSYYNRLFNQESWLYRNKLLPVVPYTANAILWYQGESNGRKEEAVNYAYFLDKLIGNWRNLWEEKLPFYLVQLMPYSLAGEKADWGAIRQAQEYVSKNTEGVYLTTLVKTGEDKLIHPTRKKSVGISLAKAVLCETFGNKQEYCGPVYDTAEWIENGVRVTFSHANELHVRGEYLEDTFVFDESDMAFTVNHKIDGNVLTLYWDTNIVATRVSMGYANNPTHNLYNREGYLASPLNLKK